MGGQTKGATVKHVNTRTRVGLNSRVGKSETSFALSIYRKLTRQNIKIFRVKENISTILSFPTLIYFAPCIAPPSCITIKERQTHNSSPSILSTSKQMKSLKTFYMLPACPHPSTLTVTQYLKSGSQIVRQA